MVAEAVRGEEHVIPLLVVCVSTACATGAVEHTAKVVNEGLVFRFVALQTGRVQYATDTVKADSTTL